MRNDHRFASLNGAGRKWLVADEIELEAEPAREANTAIPAGLDAEGEHECWAPITLKTRPLARLADVLNR